VCYSCEHEALRYNEVYSRRENILLVNEDESSRVVFRF
jgi:hypothetical protein